MDDDYQKLNVQDLLENLKVSRQVNLQGRSNAYGLYEAAIKEGLDVRIQEYKNDFRDGFEYEVYLEDDEPEDQEYTDEY